MIFFAVICTYSPCFPSNSERQKQINDFSRYFLGITVYALIFTELLSCSSVYSLYSSGPLKVCMVNQGCFLRKCLCFYYSDNPVSYNQWEWSADSFLFFSGKSIQIALIKWKESCGASAWLLVQMRGIPQQKRHFQYCAGGSAKPITACHVYPRATIWLTCGQTPHHLNKWVWV